MHALTHAVCLGMKSSGKDDVDAHLTAQCLPEAGGELGPTVRRDGGWNSKKGYPVLLQGLKTR